MISFRNSFRSSLRDSPRTLFRHSLSLLLILALLAPLALAPSVEAQSREGFARGSTQPSYGGVALERGVPLLRSFYFRYDSGDGFEDHHVNGLLVLPAGEARDLSPHADIPRPNVPRGHIRLMFQDKNRDDRYFYEAAHTPALNPGPEQRFSVRDVGCRGECVRQLPEPPRPGMTFALVGFQVFFTGSRDHHVDEIAVYERNCTLTVKLNDKNNDDVFGYLVEYTWLTPEQVRRTGTARGRDRAGARVRLPAGRAVIRGFQFDYTSKDHHLREIGALTTQGDRRLEVFFGDKNGDDGFRWAVDWALLAPQQAAGS